MNVSGMSHEKTGSGAEEVRSVNRNSLEEDEEEEESDEDLFSESREDDVISGEFEAFSDTDTETHGDEDGQGDDEISDTEAEAELFDYFDENILPPRRASCDDILGAVQAVKLNYSFPFQDAR